MSPSASPSGLTRNQHTIIIGGGVIGVCTTYYLAKRGARVTVVERDEIGKGASFGNAGCIAPGYTPINKPGRVKQAIKSLFNPLSPLSTAAPQHLVYCNRFFRLIRSTRCRIG